jgi:hypothetical protein
MLLIKSFFSKKREVGFIARAIKTERLKIHKACGSHSIHDVLDDLSLIVLQLKNKTKIICGG